ncbi:hypothetical protein F4808DRAFT_134980 [Astrocystis sublimbata]|nr:hypothetical protein F4808DRAFT_134980 [Astrocystis sublimbata]
MTTAAAAAKPDHLERTAAEPRDKSLYTVVIQHIEEVNDDTRIFRLGIPRDSPAIRFLPGQWLDVYVPDVDKAGGFTITSTPRDARLPHPPPPPAPDSPDTNTSPSLSKRGGGGGGGPYLELAIQRSPDNPPAAYLFGSSSPPPPASSPKSDLDLHPLIGTELRVRIGGGFVFPPPGINVGRGASGGGGLRRVVFVAGGMGVNPLVSMLGSIAATSANAGPPGFEVEFLYALKDRAGTEAARDLLFVERIARIFREGKVRGNFRLFLTGGKGEEEDGEVICSDDNNDGHGDGEGEGEGEEGEKRQKKYTIPFHRRRFTLDDDIAQAVGPAAERRFAVVYVCGVPTMTDELVAKLTDRKDGLGMDPHRVLCEKWW